MMTFAPFQQTPCSSTEFVERVGAAGVDDGQIADADRPPFSPPKFKNPC